MLVGRARELAALAELEPGRSFVLVGEAGIGKTALLRAVTANERQVFEGGALASLSWKAYLPITRALAAEPPDGDRVASAKWVLDAVGEGVLVLDDLHWADLETLELLPQLSGRVRMLTAVRLGDPGTGRALAAAEAAGLTRLEVERLSPQASAELLRALRPELADEAVEDVVARSDGNPLLLEELSASPEPTMSLRLSLGARLRRCSEEAQEGMALLGLLGRPAEDALVPGARELVEAGLVVGMETLAPRHSLLAETAVEELSENRRRELHSRLAVALPDAGESARHHLAAGEREAAHRKALEAAENASRYEDRARHLGIAAETADGPDADELRLRAAAAMVDIGELEAVERLVDRVGGSSPGVRAEAALCRSRAASRAGDFRLARAHLAEADSLVRGSRLDVEVRVAVEDARQQSWDLAPDTLERAERALELARETGAFQGRALTALAMAHYVLLSPRSIDIACEAYEVAQREPDVDAEVDAGMNYAVALHWAGGDGPAAYRLFGELAARATAVGYLGRAFDAEITGECTRFWAFGEPTASIEALEELLRAPAPVSARDTVVWVVVLALAYSGQAEAARQTIERESRAAESVYASSSLVAATVETSWLAGRHDRAVATAEQFWANGGADVGLNGYDIAVSEAWAHWELDGAAPHRALQRPGGFVSLDALFDELAGVRALAASEWTKAQELLDGSAGVHATTYRTAEVRARWGAAEAALRSGDVAAARRRLLAAEEQSVELGFEPLTRRTRSSLRKAGVRRRVAPAQVNGSLSRREREILGLVGEGLTTQAIASRLGIAASTVDSHIARASAKLGARSRVHAAALVTNAE